MDFTLDLFILHADQTKNPFAEINSAAYEPNNRNSYFEKKKVKINTEKHATAFLPPIPGLFTSNKSALYGRFAFAPESVYPEQSRELYWSAGPAGILLL